jgi:hypothetical protein
VWSRPASSKTGRSVSRRKKLPCGPVKVSSCKRVPTLAPAADTDSLEFKDDYLAYGVLELPVTW